MCPSSSQTRFSDDVAYRRKEMINNCQSHGDVSVQNLLIQREKRFGYSIYWIDFSASTVEASPERISHEWTKALEYFSDFVPELFIILICFR